MWASPIGPCTFVSMFCPHSCDLAQLTGEQMDIVMAWPKRTHVCMCTQEHTHAHSYSLLHHSPYERLFCRHPVSFALHSCLAILLFLCPTLPALSHRRSAFNVIFLQLLHTRALKNSSLGRIRLEQMRTVFWVKESSCFTKMHIPTQTEAHTHKNTHTHTHELASFYLTFYIIFLSASLNHLWILIPNVIR